MRKEEEKVKGVSPECQKEEIKNKNQVFMSDDKFTKDSLNQMKAHIMNQFKTVSAIKPGQMYGKKRVKNVYSLLPALEVQAAKQELAFLKFKEQAPQSLGVFLNPKNDEL